MIINKIEFTQSLMDILLELRSQLALNKIDYLKIQPRESGRNIQIQCPYHGDGKERKPSAGLRKSDGVFHCFRGDTKVITKEYGTVSMYSIVDIPVHILNGKGEWEQVVFHNYGKQPIMKLTLSCNTKRKIIYATPEHEWLVKGYNTKYQTQDLKSGMYLSKCVPKLSKVNLDPKGIIHGFCYGDGNNFSHNKDKTVYYNRCFLYNESDLELKQYFSDGKFKEELAGNGKKYECVYFQSDINLKEVPSLVHTDEYLMGFLAGYFVADGNCCRNKLTIYSHNYDDLYKVQQICNTLGIMSTEIGKSNVKAGKRGCITVKQDTYGYTLRLARNTIPDNFFITEKGRYSYQKYTGRNCYKVISVEATDIVEDVYCCQTSTHSFALENFILTGNCFACGETHDLPEVVSYCFGKNDSGAYGWQWLLKNFLTISIEERKDIVLDFSRGSSASSRNTDRNFVSEEELDSYRYCHEYWAKRGITDENIIELFDLGYDVKNKMITFPVRDIDGNCLFVAKRSVRTKFFHYPEGVQKPLYGLYELHHYMMSDVNPLWAHYQFHQGDAKEIIVCESMIDCILLWQYGHYALALNGLGNDLQFKQLRDLPCRKIILATDNDKRGIDARERIKKNVSNKIFTEIIFPSDVKDIGECYPDEIKNILEWERL